MKCKLQEFLSRVSVVDKMRFVCRFASNIENRRYVRCRTSVYVCRWNQSWVFHVYHESRGCWKYCTINTTLFLSTAYSTVFEICSAVKLLCETILFERKKKNKEYSFTQQRNEIVRSSCWNCSLMSCKLREVLCSSFVDYVVADFK